MKRFNFGFILLIVGLVIIVAKTSQSNETAEVRAAEEPKVWLPLVISPNHIPFTFAIDDSLQPTQSSLPALAGGEARSVGMAIDPEGQVNEFVSNEVIVYADSVVDLAPILTQYNGQILRDGTPFVPPGEPVPSDPTVSMESSGYYLIQIDPSASSLDDLAQLMEQAGVSGHFNFSSEEAARTLAVAARENAVHLNPLMYGGGQYNEHPDDPPGDYLAAEDWWWMRETGLSVGVTHAWEYLRYHDLPPSSGSWSPPRIAIIDGGFALDEVTGTPLNNNIDYFPNRPWQADLADYDNTAGGQNLMTCGGNPCPWHGTGVFGVSLARHSNQYGGAGTSGNAAWPMLFRVDASFYTVADAIRSAAVNGADVINLSLGNYCNSVFCDPRDGLDLVLDDAVNFATGQGAVVLAAAGNDGVSLDNTRYIPCELAKVICVGSVDQSGNNVFNFDGNVDIWAPTNIFSTVTPATAANDTNDTGPDEVQMFNGTSASTPFVAGIVGMMKALDPTIPWWEVQEILQDTANTSTDANVSQGYVDAYRAVQAVRTNQPPTVSIIYPDNNATLSYYPLSFRATAIDPETDNPDSGVVEWFSNVDGLLCTVEGFYYAGLSSSCDVGLLSLGQHTITVIATDAHGATAQESVTITAVNTPPTAEISEPNNNETFYNHQNVTLSAYVHDQDGPWEIEWRSNLDGVLGDTWQVITKLSTGTHQITVKATDELGLETEDSITLNIIPGEGVPTIVILQPTDPTHLPNTPITFEADVTDPEDGTLNGQSVKWYSNIDGFLGAGQLITASLSGPATPCNPEFIRHTVRVVATDSDGNQITEKFRLSIGLLC